MHHTHRKQYERLANAVFVRRLARRRQKNQQQRSVNAKTVRAHFNLSHRIQPQRKVNAKYERKQASCLPRSTVTLSLRGVRADSGQANPHKFNSATSSASADCTSAKIRQNENECKGDNRQREEAPLRDHLAVQPERDFASKAAN